MFRKKIVLFLLLVSSFYGQEVKSPAEIQAELDQAQKDFEIAQEIFIPWYTGPLITGSASNVPKGVTNFQGYLYFETQYAQFNDQRESVGIPDIFTLQPLLVAQQGLTDWLDVTAALQGFFRWSQGRSAQELGDTFVTLGFQIVKETPHIPNVRLTAAESFPTGNFRKLDPGNDGIDASGSGVFSTIAGFNISKILWWMKLHPMALRFSTTYEVPNHRVKVKGFHTYGGGFGTDGVVTVGHTWNADTGIEISINQRWVFATDIVYTLSFASTFSGNPGTDPLGLPAINGLPFSDQFSIAPAIEYNVSKYAGLIVGIWLPVIGKNSANFVTVVASYTHLF